MVKKLNLLSFVLGLLFLFAGLTLTVYNNFTQNKKQNVLPAKISSVPSISQSVSLSPPTFLLKNNEEVRVIRIIDGDTIEVQRDNKKEIVRLIGIDAPEMNKYQCFSEESKVKAEEILVNKNVQLETDLSQGEMDKYQRLLGYVFLNNSNFNQLMIKEGFAKEYTYKTPYKYQKEFKEAQIEAQKLKKGLWSACI